MLLILVVLVNFYRLAFPGVRRRSERFRIESETL